MPAPAFALSCAFKGGHANPHAHEEKIHGRAAMSIPRLSFIGIDPAWKEGNPSGVARLNWNDRGLTLDYSGLLRTDSEILDFVLPPEDEARILGIDAPIIAPNPKGTSRPCDREVSKVFGRFHASAHSANQERCKRPIRLRKKLEAKGFDPEPHLKPKTAPKGYLRQIEVYPHPAQVVLFQRNRIIKYKKGKVEDKRKGLAELAGRIKNHLRKGAPRPCSSKALRELLETDVHSLRGEGLKGFEDKLDALICAFIVGAYWYWGEKCWRVYGNLKKGYIVCPKLPKRYDMKG